MSQSKPCYRCRFRELMRRSSSLEQPSFIKTSNSHLARLPLLLIDRRARLNNPRAETILYCRTNTLVAGRRQSPTGNEECYNRMAIFVTLIFKSFVVVLSPSWRLFLVHFVYLSAPLDLSLLPFSFELVYPRLLHLFRGHHFTLSLVSSFPSCALL